MNELFSVIKNLTQRDETGSGKYTTSRLSGYFTYYNEEDIDINITHIKTVNDKATKELINDILEGFENGNFPYPRSLTVIYAGLLPLIKKHKIDIGYSSYYITLP